MHEYISSFIVPWIATIGVLLVVMLALIAPIVFIVGWTTWTERKIMAVVQRRVGPEIAGMNGILQPLTDGVKLMNKNLKEGPVLFIFTPMLTLVLAVMMLVILPLSDPVLGSGLMLESFWSVLVMITLSTMGEIGVIVGGFTSNGKYSRIGSRRAVYLLISSEIVLGVLLMSMWVAVGELSWSAVCVHGVVLTMYYFWIGILVDTSRTPFDLTEAEGELVAGFSTEYAGNGFVLWSFAEYLKMLVQGIVGAFLTISWVAVTGAFAMWLLIVAPLLVLIMLKATLPRMRFDEVIRAFQGYFYPVGLALLTLCLIAA